MGHGAERALRCYACEYGAALRNRVDSLEKVSNLLAVGSRLGGGARPLGLAADVEDQHAVRLTDQHRGRAGG